MSIRITWLDLVERLGHELRQLREEGVDTAALEKAWKAVPDLQKPAEAAGFLAQAAGQSVTVRQVAQREAFVAQLTGNASQTFAADRLLGQLEAAWLGRAAGCLLGKPVEKVPREGIRALLQSIGAYPLADYFTAEGVPPAVAERYPWNRASRPTSLRENIAGMPEDDDLNYPMLNLSVVERFGPQCTTENIAQVWLESMPVLTVFTAERVAYLNLLNYLLPPQTALHHNPYREWIGAQIRADLWGYIYPGDPVAAARAAFMDARLSHVENGIWGEMMVAAMVAQAFVSRDLYQIIQTGLAVIPADSRLALAVEQVLKLDLVHQPWEVTLDALYVQLGSYHWVHTINNAALVVAALIYGQGDYQRSITAAVMGGWDTDCNGATVGSIVGLINEKVPSKWTTPLQNRLRTSLKGFDQIGFDRLAQRTQLVIEPKYLQP